MHLGVIPDGNRRWARERGIPTLMGHKRGMEAMKTVSLAAFERGVSQLTLFGFSTENWSRTSEEVKYLMALFYTLLDEGIDEFEKRGIRFKFLGSREKLPKRLIKLIDRVEARTARLLGGTLALCLNYGGQQEMADALKSMIAAGVKPEEVTPELVAEHLYAGSEIGPLDLIIRTSGEHRSSGFMLWRAAYAEYYFSPKNWPDFTTDDLDLALADFAGRQRRFGS